MRKYVVLLLIVSTTVLVSCTHQQTLAVIPAQDTTPIVHTKNPDVTPEPTITPEPIADTDIVIGIGGDIMMHKSLMIDVSYSGNSFDHWFENIAPALSYPDLMMVNLEGPLAGTDHISYGYPAFNFPDQILDSFIKYDVDVVLNGNNHVFDWYAYCVDRTIDTIDSAGLMHTGAWHRGDTMLPLMVDIEGINVGILNTTESVNGYRDKLYQEPVKSMVVIADDYTQIEYQIGYLEEMGVDIIIATPHMGSEFQTDTSQEYIDIAQEYIRLGVDVIVAHHPHTIQPVERLTVDMADGTQRSAIVFWSIGNMIGDMHTNHCETGIISYINISKDNNTDEVTITGAEYLPIYTVLEHGYRKFFWIVPLEDGMDDPRLEQERQKIFDRLGDDVAKPMLQMPAR